MAQALIEPLRYLVSNNSRKVRLALCVVGKTFENSGEIFLGLFYILCRGLHCKCIAIAVDYCIRCKCHLPVSIVPLVYLVFYFLTYRDNRLRHVHNIVTGNAIFGYQDGNIIVWNAGSHIEADIDQISVAVKSCKTRVLHILNSHARFKSLNLICAEFLCEITRDVASCSIQHACRGVEVSLPRIPRTFSMLRSLGLVGVSLDWEIIVVRWNRCGPWE